LKKLNPARRSSRVRSRRELSDLVISQKDKVASDLLDALNEMMSSSDERDEELVGHFGYSFVA
jgi:hypothetical protein